MIRLQSSEQTHTSEAWQPTGETLLQLKTELSSVRVEVQSRLDAAAEWVTVSSLNSRSNAMARLAQVPFMRLVLKGNQSGKTVTVWGV